jgi:hypothetical protein
MLLNGIHVERDPEPRAARHPQDSIGVYFPIAGDKPVDCHRERLHFIIQLIRVYPRSSVAHLPFLVAY